MPIVSCTDTGFVRCGERFHLSYTTRVAASIPTRRVEPRRIPPSVAAALAVAAPVVAQAALRGCAPHGTVPTARARSTRSSSRRPGAPERSFDVPASVDTHRRARRSATASRWSTCRRRWCACPASSPRTARTTRRTCRSARAGFGARATFGVRGVRLYQDDIPATMPDGQGQTGSFSLLSAAQHRGAARAVLDALRQRVRAA